MMTARAKKKAWEPPPALFGRKCSSDAPEKSLRWPCDGRISQEQNTLVTMSHSPRLTLSVELTERLELLGLAERGLGGTIISAAGRQLIWRRPKKELEE